MPGAVVLRSDIERKALFGVGETERLPEAAYAADATARVYATLADKARRTTAAGHSAIVDAVYAQPAERADIGKAAGNAAFHGLFLTADLETRLARVGARTGDASDADTNVARKQDQFELGRITWSRVDASGTPEETLIRARAMIGLE
jgi:predicted kinase